MKNYKGIIWGIILVAVGVIFAVDSLGIAEVNIFFDGWWTLFIIVPCAIGLFTEREKLGNVIGVIVGIYLLLWCQDVVSIKLLGKLAVPALIVIIGVKLICKSIFSSKHTEKIKMLRGDGKKLSEEIAIFSGKDLKYDLEVFEGVELNAIFGGINCDLTKAIIEKDCVITLSAIFGGIDLYLPENVNIKIRSNSLFGGVSDKSHRNSKDNAVTVYIDATCMFGGADIK